MREWHIRTNTIKKLIERELGIKVRAAMKPVKAVSMEKLTDSSLELEREQQHQVN